MAALVWLLAAAGLLLGGHSAAAEGSAAAAAAASGNELAGWQLFEPLQQVESELAHAGPASGERKRREVSEKEKAKEKEKELSKRKEEKRNKKKRVGHRAKGFDKECLDEHNKWRKLHQVGELKFDRKITAFAKKRAEFIAQSDGSEFKHPPDLPYGENLAWHSRSSQSCASLVKLWYDEVEMYDFKSAGFSFSTGHFTQLVWKATKRLGCAKAIGAGSRGGVYLVCNYDPPGNFVGMASFNVFPAKSRQGPTSSAANSSSAESAAGAPSSAGVSPTPLAAGGSQTPAAASEATTTRPASNGSGGEGKKKRKRKGGRQSKKRRRKASTSTSMRPASLVAR